MEHPILELRNISKKYPGVSALEGVSMKFYKGEVHAIVGENGAGKSTFIKIITGAIEQTGGEIIFEQDTFQTNNPIISMKKGIAAIYQEFNGIPYLSVAENIYYGRQPIKKGFIDYKKMNEDAMELLGTLGIHMNPKIPLRKLSVGYQQIVEIAKAISRKAKVLIMDEPSAPLTTNELNYLFKIVNKLKEQGVCIVYISHRMEEIFELCDTVTVFRDGKKIKTMPVQETNQEELITLMVNRKLEDTFPVRNCVKGDTILEVKDLVAKDVNHVSFALKKGEILGFAGLVGAGRTEIANAVFGAAMVLQGTIELEGKTIVNQSPTKAIEHGIALIPEDRKKFGALMNMNIKENITFSNLKKISGKRLFIRKRKEIEWVNGYRKQLRIKCSGIHQKVLDLSGGNQQKVILARCLFTDCKILIFDEPTRGIDIGAKHEIYQLMNKLVEEGKSIILISSEMPELLGMADRIMVIRQGSIAGTFSKEEATQEKILALASGV